MITKQLIRNTLNGDELGWNTLYETLSFNGVIIARYLKKSITDWFVDKQPLIDDGAIDYLLSIGLTQSSKFLEKYYEANK